MKLNHNTKWFFQMMLLTFLTIICICFVTFGTIISIHIGSLVLPEVLTDENAKTPFIILAKIGLASIVMLFGTTLSLSFGLFCLTSLLPNWRRHSE